MVELNQIKEDIAAIGNRIKELKSKGADADKNEIAKAVQELLDKKQLYADNNNGIGADGKPFKANMTKAEKKKQQEQEQQQVRKCLILSGTLLILYSYMFNTSNFCHLFPFFFDSTLVSQLLMRQTLPRRLPRRLKRLRKRPPTRMEQMRLGILLLNKQAEHPSNRTNPALRPSRNLPTTSSRCNW
jgi:hypothetical protein